MSKATNMAEGEINIDNLIQRLLEGKKKVFTYIFLQYFHLERVQELNNAFLKSFLIMFSLKIVSLDFHKSCFF